MSQLTEVSFGAEKVETVFRYNEAEYEFDIRDADSAELFENAIEHMKETEKKIPKEGKISVLYRLNCKLIKDFFDDTLGKGAGTAICTERDNVTVCYDAYNAFLTMVSKQKNTIVDAKNVFAKYSNREQRRHPQTNK